MKLRPGNPELDVVHLPIHLRCFARPVAAEPKADEPSTPKTRRKRVGPSEVSLTFDTETTTDATQRLRVLFYQLRIEGQLDEEGAAYDPAVLKSRELATLRRYCDERGLPPPITLEAFREEIFLAKAHGLGAAIIGFNLAFDLARIAVRAASARANKWKRKMQGAFTFVFSEDGRWPHLQIKHLNSRASIYEFTAPGQQPATRSYRREGRKPRTQRGYFTDVRTLAGAVLGGSYTLARLTAVLNTKTQKQQTEEHGDELSVAYLDYARADVQATWECFEALCAKYHAYGLSAAHYELFSEASLGKATLEAMGIRPWLACNPSPDPDLIAKIMCTYFGGRTEVRFRKDIRRVIHTDFTSMYPTVCTLQGLWRFITATGFTTRDSTKETKAFLADIGADDLRRPPAWRNLATIVRIRPDGDLVPIRAPYSGGKSATISLNHLTYDGEIWLTLADCIAAKLLSGRAPEVLEAIRFEPGLPQTGLRPLKLFGIYAIDPLQDDLFQKIIRLRIDEKARAKTLDPVAAAKVLDACDALKTTANSTSYGIFVQINVSSEDRGAPVEVFDPVGEPFTTRTKKVETPGPFFHPLLATLITGAARLMLALAEHQATAEGLDWVFCDTDSLALARPDGMLDADFQARALRVVDWFAPLNPYGLPDSILKIEDANYSHLNPGALAPLYCLAISSKRYVLFNLGDDGRPIIRKGSAHGLGHLLAPYGDDDPAEGIHPPTGLEVGQDRLLRWQYDLWFKIIEAAQAGRLESLKFEYHHALRRPAVSRYAATSPELLRWFKTWNADKSYAEQVKPFGFLLALHAKRGRKGRGGGKTEVIYPIAPFDTDHEKAAGRAFDRVAGDPIRRADLQTYQEALSGYQLSPEDKFANGRAYDKGRTERRHVIASAVEFIGKEADRWEETFFLGVGVDLAVGYGRSPLKAARAYAAVREAARQHGDAAVAKATGLPRSSVAKIKTGVGIRTRIPYEEIQAGLQRLTFLKFRAFREKERRRAEAAAAIQREGGLRAAARALGVDPSNLSRYLRRR